jgi:glycosyltransferase involved in cell wall biosynthesis
VIHVKVLMVTPHYYPCIGGVEVVVKEVTERMAEKGHLCSLLTLNTCAGKEEEELNQVHIKRFSARFSKYLFDLSPELLVYTLRNLTVLNSFDIIHVHDYSSLLTFQMIFLAKKALDDKPKVICSPFYHAKGHSRIASILRRVLLPLGQWTLRQVDAVICVSDYESSLFKHNFPVPYEKVWTIPIGVGRIELQSKSKDASRPVSLLYVGRVERYKGIQFILRAMAHLRTAYDVNSSLTIVGAGPYASELRENIKRFDLQSSVRWLSNLRSAELDKEYINADMLLLLSEMESYGLVVAEALAHGTPCILSRTSALAEFLNEAGCFGVEYPPDDAALAALILKVYNDSVAVDKLSEKVRIWDEVAEDYVRVYNKTLAT